MEPPESVCIICLDSDPPPIQSGCACRGPGGLAHITCLIKVAVSRPAQRGYAAWHECQSCKQDFTGPMRTGLAEAWWMRMRDEDEESAERLAAAANLAQSLYGEGKHAEADRIFREVHSVQIRVLGVEHPNTLSSAANLALGLSNQGKYAEAEQIQREVYAVEKRVIGAEHPSTLASAANLAVSLSHQGKHAEAEQINREVLAIQMRVLGAEHMDTLSTAANLAVSLSDQAKYAEAEQLLLEVYAIELRVLGAEHPSTLSTATNAAATLFFQHKYAEARQQLEAVLEAQLRVLGAAHPDTINTAHWLARSVRQRLRWRTPCVVCWSLFAPRPKARVTLAATASHVVRAPLCPLPSRRTLGVVAAFGIVAVVSIVVASLLSGGIGTAVPRKRE